MKRVEKLTVFDRLEIDDLAAYLNRKPRTAENFKKAILEDLGNRRSKVLVIADLARYEGYDTKEAFSEFLNIFKTAIMRRKTKESSTP